MSFKVVNKIKYLISKDNGFTLVEMLVVVALFGFVVTAIVGIFLASLRGAAKSEVIQRVRQEGNYALTIMNRQLRAATGINSCALNSVVYKDVFGTVTNFTCAIDVGGANYIASGSSRLTSEEVVVAPCSITCSGNPFNQVTIDFTVSQAGEGGVTEEASADFQTLVTVRGI